MGFCHIIILIGYNMIINDRAILLPGQSAIAVFTKTGKNLDEGKTGIWKIDPTKSVNKIIIYHRHDHVNEIIVGDFKTISNSNDPRRFYLHSDNFRSVGFTPKNWNEFALTGSNPVRYYP